MRGLCSRNSIGVNASGVKRVSVQIIPGDLKANIPLRVALALPTGVDSRVVLDAEGAEKLAPPGDALVLQGHKITRVSTPNFAAPAPPLDLGNEDDPRLLGLSPDARAVFVRIQEAGCRATVRAVMEQFRWGERRAARALQELRMAGLLEGKSETETNAHPPMLPVTVASVVDVVDVVECENRGKNGQGVQKTHFGNTGL